MNPSELHTILTAEFRTLLPAHRARERAAQAVQAISLTPADLLTPGVVVEAITGALLDAQLPHYGGHSFTNAEATRCIGRAIILVAGEL